MKYYPEIGEKVMINKNNKNVQITLDPDSYALLDSLAVRFHTSKSIIIKNALKVYSAKKSHLIKISYTTLQEVAQTEPKPNVEKTMSEEDEEAWNELVASSNEIK